MDLSAESPQDAAWALLRALKSESESIGVTFSHTEQEREVSTSLTVDMQKNGKELRAVITYVHQVNLGAAQGTIGNGFIGDFGDIELMYEGFPEEIEGPPYHWGMWPRGVNYLYALDQCREVTLDLVKQAIKAKLM